MSYLLSIENDVNDATINNDNLIVYLSLVLTIMSLLTSLIQTSVTGLSLLKEYNNKVIQITEIEIKFTLSCTKLNSQHLYCHDKINSCIIYMLQKSKHHEYWMDRSGSSLITDLFYIDDYISLQNG